MFGLGRHHAAHPEHRSVVYPLVTCPLSTHRSPLTANCLSVDPLHSYTKGDPKWRSGKQLEQL